MNATSLDTHPSDLVAAAPVRDRSASLLRRFLPADPRRRPADHYWDHREASWVAPTTVERAVRRSFPS